MGGRRWLRPSTHPNLPLEVRGCTPRGKPCGCRLPGRPWSPGMHLKPANLAPWDFCFLGVAAAGDIVQCMWHGHFGVLALLGVWRNSCPVAG